MQKSIFSTLVLILCFSTLFSQSLDSYKYILIPNQYEFQRSADQYQINSLVKFLFNRAGYEAFLTSDELPQDLRNDHCLAAKAFIEVKPSMLSVKTSVRLEDCFGKPILVTKEARSKEKDYQKAYHESIRRTFVEIEELTYNYSPYKKETAVLEKVVEPKKIVPKQIEEEVILKKEVKAIENLEDKKEEKKEKLTKTNKEIKKNRIGEPEEKIEMIKIKPEIFNLVGNYEIEGWGKSEIIKKGDEFVIKGGDENFEFATIYKTSKPNIYIIKWVAYKQPQLMQIDSNGSLRVDAKDGVKYYKRI